MFWLTVGLPIRRSSASFIPATSLTALQYNILSVVKSFTAYETMGKLFGAVSKESLGYPLQNVYEVVFKK